MALKVISKILLVISGGEQMHFEFMTKICNCSRLFDDPGSVVGNLAPADLADLTPYCKVFS